MIADSMSAVSFQPRDAIQRILGVGIADLFAETPLVAALRAGTPREQLPSGVSCELEIATLMALHDVAFTEAQIVWLQRPSTLLVQDQALPISNGLVALALSRPELKGQLDLDTPEGRGDLLSWWMLQGRGEALMPPMLGQNEYALPSSRASVDFPLPLTRGLEALWRAIPALNSVLDLSSQDGVHGLVSWWLMEGQKLPCGVDVMPVLLCQEASPFIEQDQPLPITRGIHALALALPELQSSVDLDTRAGRTELIRWWMLTGRVLPEFSDLVGAETYLDASPEIEQDQPLPITRGMHALALSLPELQSSVALDTRAGRTELIRWWMGHGCRHLSFEGLGGHEGWDEPSPLLHEAPFLTRGLHALWISRADLQQAFEISTTVGRQGLLDWYPAYGDGVLYRPPSKEHQVVVANIFIPPSSESVNILGYGRGELGIGEDVRMAFAAFEAAGVKACVPRLPLRIGARQSDMSVIRAETEVPIYGTNLICLPFFETLRLLGKTRETVLDCRYNIAFWQWELPHFPQEMTCAFDLVDEIWASSEFTASTMRGSTKKPVFLMPMVVCLPEKWGQWRRADFSLPEDAFVFLTVLDGASSLKRKNPLAVVRAFLKAFPRDRRARLVVKAMNVNTTQEDWRSVRDYASEDERITLIAETMAKDKLLGLQSACDCFVSLHRSEGFGRNIAEAMLLGKPVVVSDYSGNRDFTRPETAFLVPGELLPLEEGDYPFWEGQYWFEADTDSAAAALAQCFDRPDLRLSRAEAGQAWIRENYSATRVGQAYRDRLDVLKRVWSKPA